MPVRLAKACVRVLPISGAGISLYTAATMRIPVGASDDDAAVAESLQFTAAEGPCFDALRTGRMVVATEPVIARWWPDFHDKLVSHTAVRGIIAAPLGDGPAGIGVLDLYCDRSADVQSIDLFEVHSVAQYITEVLVQEQLLPALRRGSMWDRARWLGNPGVTGRSQVLMAMGMVSVALSLNLDDALAILRARGYGIAGTHPHPARRNVTKSRHGSNQKTTCWRRNPRSPRGGSLWLCAIPWRAPRVW